MSDIIDYELLSNSVVYMMVTMIILSFTTVILTNHRWKLSKIFLLYGSLTIFMCFATNALSIDSMSIASWSMSAVFLFLMVFEQFKAKQEEKTREEDV